MKPFLKWVGSKQSLVDKLLKRVPPSFKVYHEPFLGSGAMYLALLPKRARLSDSNEELIRTFRTVRDDHRTLWVRLSVRAAMKVDIEEEKKRYHRMRSLDPALLNDTEAAERMIYLNRTGFNGLYRVNSKGRFNVPFGNRLFTLPDQMYTQIASAFEQLSTAALSAADFRLALKAPSKGDFVYLDPPYVPVSRTASFTGYQPGGFTIDDQVRLAEICGRLHKKEVKWMLSNADTELARALYEGYNITELTAKRSVSASGESRGPAKELVVTNY